MDVRNTSHASWVKRCSDERTRGTGQGREGGGERGCVKREKTRRDVSVKIDTGELVRYLPLMACVLTPVMLPTVKYAPSPPDTFDATTTTQHSHNGNTLPTTP